MSPHSITFNLKPGSQETQNKRVERTEVEQNMWTANEVVHCAHAGTRTESGKTMAMAERQRRHGKKTTHRASGIGYRISSVDQSEL